MDDLLEGLLAGASDGCMVVLGAFLALVLLGALVSLLFEPAFWLLAVIAGIAAAALRWSRRDRADTTVDPDSDQIDEARDWLRELHEDG